jgi:hypothetical protein
MSKGQNSNKEIKKKPTMTPKEKRATKRARQETKMHLLSDKMP